MTDSNKTEREWGYYTVLHEFGKIVKLKELTVEPKKCLSLQRHQMRLEHWFVAEGTATVYTIDDDSDVGMYCHYEQFQHISIKRNQWHRLSNETETPLKVIEIQYGDECIEEDIERK
jgi:mannose-6-phosphate isomerase-like protein (cupin superfamily)